MSNKFLTRGWLTSVIRGHSIGGWKYAFQKRFQPGAMIPGRLCARDNPEGDNKGDNRTVPLSPFGKKVA